MNANKKGCTQMARRHSHCDRDKPLTVQPESACIPSYLRSFALNPAFSCSRQCRTSGHTGLRHISCMNGVRSRSPAAASRLAPPGRHCLNVRQGWIAGCPLLGWDVSRSDIRLSPILSQSGEFSRGPCKAKSRYSGATGSVPNIGPSVTCPVAKVETLGTDIVLENPQK